MFRTLISRTHIRTSLTVLAAVLVVVALAYASAPAVYAQEALPNPIRLLDDATGGDCTLVGTWDAGSKTCTLTRDIDVGVKIGETYGMLDGVTLDGAGHTISAGGSTGSASATIGVR